MIERLQWALPPKAFRVVEPHYLEEPRGKFHGQAEAVIAPETVQEVSQVIAMAAETGTPVVPYGGGTGLVGGQVSSDGPAPILLSMERMTKVRGIYPSEAVMVVEAGAILQDVQEAAADVGMLFPLSLAAQGSCRIGGNLATNAGGVNVLRYGNARELCLGLEAVLPDGSIWNGLKRLRKDNTGYDLKNLLIGSEGTLGVITAASLKMVPRPTSEAVALLVVPDPSAALALLGVLREQVGEAVSAFELIAGQGLKFLADVMPDVRIPLENNPEWAVLIELGMQGDSADAAAAFERIFEEALEKELVLDGVIASSEAQRQAFWAVRENLPEANKRIGALASHDISLPLSLVPEFISQAVEKMKVFEGVRINCFGHMGDGNLHFNAFPPAGVPKKDKAHLGPEITRMLHDLTDEMGGSFSAEHGVGRLKVADLERYGDPAKLAAMRAIKAALDPKGIMNPGAVLRG